MSSDFLSFVPSVLLQLEPERTITPAFAGAGVFLLLVLVGLLLVLILREKLKDRRKQVPPLPPSYYRQAPPLPSKRSAKGPPDLPRGY